MSGFCHLRNAWDSLEGSVPGLSLLSEEGQGSSVLHRRPPVYSSLSSTETLNFILCWHPCCVYTTEDFGHDQAIIVFIGWNALVCCATVVWVWNLQIKLGLVVRACHPNHSEGRGWNVKPQDSLASRVHGGQARELWNTLIEKVKGRLEMALGADRALV